MSSPKISQPAPPPPPPEQLDPMKFSVPDNDPTKKRATGVARLQIPLGGMAGKSGLGIPGRK